jgi:hypothetical protein
MTGTLAPFHAVSSFGRMGRWFGALIVAALPQRNRWPTQGAWKVWVRQNRTVGSNPTPSVALLALTSLAAGSVFGHCSRLTAE